MSAAKISEIADDALALVEIERDALVFVDAEPPKKLQGDLADRQQSALDRRNGHARLGVRMNDAGRVVARHMDRAVDGEARGIDAMRALPTRLPSTSIFTSEEAVISSKRRP